MEDIILRIQKLLIDKTGKVKGFNIKKSQNKEILQLIEEINNLIPFYYTLSDKIYCILNDIKKPLECKECGKPLNTLKRTVCSLECQYKINSKALKERLDKLTEEEYKKIKEKQVISYKNSWKNKSQREKEIIWSKQQRKRDSKSEEEKKNIQNKRQKTMNSDPLKKQQRIINWQRSLNSRPQEKKNESENLRKQNINKFWSNPPKEWLSELKKKRKINTKKIWAKRTIEEIKNIGNKISKSNKEASRRKTPEQKKNEVKKRNQTKDINCTHNSSTPESKLEGSFKVNFPLLHIFRHYRDSERYNFACDFYIQEFDLFIEYHGSQYHNSKLQEIFDKDSITHQNVLAELVKKAEILRQKNLNKPNQYDNIIKTWTDLDVRKYNMAKSNNLNYLILWNQKDIDQFLKNDLHIEYTKQSMIKELGAINSLVPSYKKGNHWNKIILTYQPHFYEKEKGIWKNNLGIRAKLLNNRCQFLNKKINELTDYELLSGFKKSGIYYGFSHTCPFHIKKFIQDHKIKSIYDPFGGWGHRLLGSGDILYIYNDIDQKSFEGAKNIAKDFNLQNKVFYNEDSSKFTPTENYEAVFTCPPYYNLEKYNNKGGSNINNEIKFLEWWEQVVKYSLKESVKYFCFTINRKNKDKMVDVCEQFNLSVEREVELTSKKSHFIKNNKKNKECLVIMKKYS